MTGDTDPPAALVAELPDVGTSVVLEGTEEWLSTLEDPHDSSVLGPPVEFDEP